MQKLDDVDRKILDILIDNTRTPFTDIAKRLLISPGTVHVRVKKMEDLGIIKGSSLTLDYKMLGYNFIAYVGILIDRSRRTYEIIQELEKINNETDIECHLIYIVQRTDVESMQTSNIDLIYKKAVQKAWLSGVKIKVVQIKWNEYGEAHFYSNTLPINLFEFQGPYRIEDL